MAFSIVRLIDISSSQISVLFNENIDTDVGVANVNIVPKYDNVPSVTVTSVVVDQEEIIIKFLPIFSGVQYRVSFVSTTSQNFQSLAGEQIVENGRNNSILIVGPEVSSEIKDNMMDSLSIVYDKDETSFINDLVTSSAFQLGNVQDTIDTVRSGNYLSVTVEDELITRGSGAIDKFENGGAFEILRVGSSPSGQTRYGTLRFDSTRYNSFVERSDTIVNDALKTITSDPISLQSIDVLSEEVSSNSNLDNYFDGLTIKVANRPVIQLVSVTLKRGSNYIPYNINRFGYTLKDNQYDSNNALINVNLSSQEIQLSSSSITGEEGGFLNPVADDKIIVSYVYKNLGRNVSDVNLYTIKQSVREAVGATLTSFYLNNAPIIASNDSVPTTGGVSFLNTIEYDGNSPFTASHPAFTSEIVFDLSKTPSRPGQFSVNYSTGQVLVYGEDINNQGTGANPPLATYYYRKQFISGTDYTFNSDTDEMALSSSRNIAGIEAKVTFQYEDNFTNGEDFNFLSHIEVTDERADNRVPQDFAIQTKKFPITDVFRIFNETTGEIYTPTRFNDTTVFFSGRKAPLQLDVVRERAVFNISDQETLFVSDALTNTYGYKIFKLELSNSGVSDSKQRFIGSNFDSSVSFSNTDIFQNEMFYEDKLFTSVSTNLDRLTEIGYFSIDYTNGIVYVAVNESQGSNLGSITYRYVSIKTKNDHIIKVNDVYRSANAATGSLKSYNVSSFSDTSAVVSGLEQVGERFLNNNSTRPLLIGTYQSGEDGITTSGSNLFTSNSASFSSDDVGRTLIIGTSGNTPVQQVDIVSVVSSHVVEVDDNITYTGKERVWVILDLSTGASKTITLENDIVSVNDIYLVSSLGTEPISSLDGYYNVNIDSFSGNVITLGDDNPLSVGDAVIVNYNFGNLFVDYRYISDEVLVSYEYGNNSLEWSISNVLSSGDEYYVSYKYGALREPLLLNFGSLTQIPILTNFPYNFDREVYRSVVGGALQSFIKGPTIPAIKLLVESLTDVTPDITEFVFSNWVLGRDYLHLNDVYSNATASYDIGKYNNGIRISSGQYVRMSAVSHLRLEEGTMECWVRPDWNGLDNDSTITFDLYNDGYRSETDIYIGFDAENPADIPFSLSAASENVLGQPKNIDNAVGFFIWYDESSRKWNVRWRESNLISHDFTGTITSSGSIYNIETTDSDGYELNEITDVITSSTQSIDFSASVDGYESVVGYSIDGMSFSSGDDHYLLDLADSSDVNRMSLFKDGLGYLNFRVIDNRKNITGDVGIYNIATYVGSWEASELHHIAASWTINSYNSNDELHLFVDGQEVPNLFKYGGNPQASSQYNFGDVGEETVVSTATKPTVGGYDGASESGSNLFRSVGINFENRGVSIGDSLYILEENADGTEDLLGGVYTITGVGGNTLTLDRSLTLTLGSIDFSVNPIISTVTTPINIQKFAVFSVDADNVETELKGLYADEPDYSVSRGTNYSHVLMILDGVDTGDSVIIKTYGLIFRRCKEQVFIYDNNNGQIKTNFPYPATLGDVDITSIMLSKRLVSIYNDEFSILPDGTLYSSYGGDGYDSQFRDGYIYDDGYVCQPSNQFRGRKISVSISGDNINYGVNKGNRVILTGLTDHGSLEETLYFDSNGVVTTTEYWKNIESVQVFIVPIDLSEHAGVIEMREFSPITQSENHGDYAEIVSYQNGTFYLEVYGSGGVKFDLNNCLYELDYPTYLKLNIEDIPEYLYIGSDFNGNNEFDGTIDELRILNTMYPDLRVGEESVDGKDITSDYNRITQFEKDNNTITLLHFNSNLDDSSDYLDSFDEGFQVAPSVNTLFGSAMRVSDDRKYEVSNAGSIFNNDEGTIEFWVSPMLDAKDDPNIRYYVDISSSVQETLNSYTKLNLTVSQRVREINSIRLASDYNNTGIDYFKGGSVSNIDGKTITLGTPLPAQNTSIKVDYIPLSASGDRVSIFKDTSGDINFFVKASGVEHLITTEASWDRNTWHRVVAMWATNTSTNTDRLRLFVDGTERGTIKYGTGLIYGTGVLYGQAEVRSGVNKFIVDDINLNDTFSKIFIGTDIYGINNAMARIDNIRFSDEQRTNTLRSVGSDVFDTNYNSTDSLAVPVVSDLITTLLLDFDKEVVVIDDFATVIDSSRGIFRFQIDVLDSFNKITGNEVLKQLLEDLVETLKPAHSESILNFIDED